MIVVFRIVKSEDKGESVVLTLACDGFEDPKLNAVVFDDDDLPTGIKKGHCTFEGEKRPKVMVNGVEMFLKSFSTTPKYTVTPDDLVTGVISWAALSGMPSSCISELAKQYSVCIGADKLMMEVMWE